jgi:hypothetical protein
LSEFDCFLFSFEQSNIFYEISNPKAVNYSGNRTSGTVDVSGAIERF